jgi:isochorismate synthase EntC
VGHRPLERESPPQQLIPTRAESDSLPQQGKVPRKQFFFEKKNQKTFAGFGTGQSYQARKPAEQKSFGSFLQKRTASSVLFPKYYMPNKP